MKLKVLVIIFNTVLILMFSVIFLFPVFFLNGDFMHEFWIKNWFFLPIFFILLGIVNIIFLKNWKLVSYIEEEDWTALTMYLEQEIFDKKKLSYKKVRLLSETLLLLSDFSGLSKLETVLRANKPGYIIKLAPKFAAAKMLSGNYQELCAFSNKLAARPDNTHPWINFYAAFSHQMLKEYTVAAEKFLTLAKTSTDLIIKALSAYFIKEVLSPYLEGKKEKVNQLALSIKDEIKKKYNRNQWDEYIEKEKKEIDVMVLTKIIKETNDWIFT
ncbi:hypothetical protein [Treponema phagedenis]|uniref:hypothetical protein n=1 Tax=Treponema phagedenis TaxID=162 RepID=UPI000463188B|nr:hypothetical protein [Treponema phagedenis]NVP23024.1 hypothetical protein [Treponema phagedenis]QEJ95144.1 hypothetical protein FUT79_07990 [Treponema phagedenis]QKS92389.1 hypothetical protein HPJ96_07425 [Treponema phagedenis]QLC57901.1 hypothetical protein HW453_03080 [Treponema phagedenis]